MSARTTELIESPHDHRYGDLEGDMIKTERDMLGYALHGRRGNDHDLR